MRPGWFDYNDADQHQLRFLQGDTRHAGNPSDGVISRRQIAQVLVAALTSPHAAGMTFELVAEPGDVQADLDPLFAGLEPDGPDALDGVRDEPNMPQSEEPAPVLHDLDAIRVR